MLEHLFYGEGPLPIDERGEVVELAVRLAAGWVPGEPRNTPEESIREQMRIDEERETRLAQQAAKLYYEYLVAE